jgi:hypothetical protein
VNDVRAGQAVFSGLLSGQVNMGYFKKVEQDIGVCAAVKCPHCHAESRFNLHKLATIFTVWSVDLFDLDRIYQLSCSRCRYRKDIADCEIFSAVRAVKLFSKFESHTLAATDYEQALAKFDFPSLKELLGAATFWTCPQCTEEVPANFNECWKCKAVRPNLEGLNPTEAFAAPKLHPHITRPANPWD